MGVAWNGNSVNWQHSGDERAEFNKTDHAYYYAALLMAESEMPRTLEGYRLSQLKRVSIFEMR